MNDKHDAHGVKLQMLESCEQLRGEAFELMEHAASLLPLAGRTDLSAIYAPFLNGETEDAELRTACQTVSNSLGRRLDDMKVVFTYAEDVEDVVGEHRGLALQYGMATRGGISALVDSTLEALGALVAIDRYRAMIDSGEAVLVADDAGVKFVALEFFESVECLQRSWREYAYALVRLAKVPLIAEQIRDHDSIVTRNNGRHKKNREAKQSVLDWYSRNRHRFPRDKSGAASAAIVEINLNITHETVVNWLKVSRSPK